jgi:hypothetical protein
MLHKHTNSAITSAQVAPAGGKTLDTCITKIPVRKESKAVVECALVVTGMAVSGTNVN